MSAALRSVVLAALAIATFATTGCITIPVLEPRSARPFSPDQLSTETGLAQIVVFREHKLEGSAVRLHIGLDGELVADIHRGEAFVLDVPPGDHTLGLPSSEYKAKVEYLDLPAFPFKVSANERLYFELLPDTEVEGEWVRAHRGAPALTRIAEVSPLYAITAKPPVVAPRPAAPTPPPPPTAVASAEPNPTPPSAEPQIVVVFDIQDTAQVLTAEERAALREYLTPLLTQAGTFKLVPSSDLKEALSMQKKDSYKACYDESCQIEIGKELAAEASLAPKITRLASVCVVSLQLYDLKSATSGQSALQKGGCGYEELMASMESAVEELTKR